MGGERGVWNFISYVGQGGESAFALLQWRSKVCIRYIYIYIYKVSVCVCVSLFGRAIFVSSMPTHTHYLLTGPPSFCFI